MQSRTTGWRKKNLSERSSIIKKAIDVAEASQAMDIAPGAGVKSHMLARRIGVHPKTIRRAWKRGDLPGIAHGPRCLMIPWNVCKLVTQFGLLRVAGMRRRGEI